MPRGDPVRSGSADDRAYLAVDTGAHGLPDSGEIMLDLFGAELNSFLHTLSDRASLFAVGQHSC